MVDACEQTKVYPKRSCKGSDLMDQTKVTGVVLAGGRSSRMGTNKALLTVGSRKVIETLISAMSGVAEDVWIAANDREAYQDFGRTIVPDLLPGQGPLSGIHAALHATKTPWVLVAACDMPFVPPELFGFLQDAVNEAEASHTGVQGCQAVIPVEQGRVQPLLAAYHVSALPALEESLRSGKLRMTDWLEQLEVRYVSEEDVARATGRDAGHVFFNMNSPEDYERAVRKQEHEEEEG